MSKKKKHSPDDRYQKQGARVLAAIARKALYRNKHRGPSNEKVRKGSRRGGGDAPKDLGRESGGIKSNQIRWGEGGRPNESSQPG